ncbi:hypothetical protein ScPMuIL_014944 [Solemya velum]
MFEEKAMCHLPEGGVLPVLKLTWQNRTGLKGNRITFYDKTVTSAGSPADQADLEVGDEIIEVNGHSLENLSHADIITHIHKCIKAKTICLRVKRKKKNTGNCTARKIQNAYIIAVEDEARKRLEKLSNLKKIVPLDMTKIHDGDDDELSTEVISDSATIVGSMPFNTKGSHASNGHVELKDMNGYVEKESPKKGKGKRHHKSSSSVDTPLIESVVTYNQFGTGVEVNSQNSLNGSRDTITDGDDSLSDAANHNSFDTEDNGPHREMAIDVPDNFIATAKTPPRFPPPHSTHSSPGHHISTPSKTSLNDEKVRTSTMPSSVTTPNSNQKHQVTPEELVRLHLKHEDDLRKRIQEENRIAVEEDFLRTSLRSSKKLQTLENKKHPKGVVNEAFMETADASSQDGPTCPIDRYMKKNIGLEDMFSAIHHLQTKLSMAGDKEKIAFLQNLCQNGNFQQAVRIHQKVIEVTSRSPPPKPSCTNAQELVQEVMVAVQQSPMANDLVNLFLQDNFKSLLQAHDCVAEQKVQPVVGPQVEDDFLDYSISLYGKGSVKIVHLEKTNEPLGATVRNEEDSVVIGRIVEGGVAEQSGLLHEGDELLEVNGIEIKGKSINDVSELLANMSGLITFMIIPSSHLKQNDQTIMKPMNVKAMFNYEAEEDMYIPCRELGISFMKGDILHVINQEDSNWWQAYREDEEEQHALAGLIPSKSFHEQREALKQTLSDGSVNPKKMRACACGRKDKKKKRKMYKGEDDSEEILSYEEMAMYYPQPNRKRPIVLIGPPNIGRDELRKKLMQSDCDRFAQAVPHTSKPKEPWQVEGKDFHFLSRSMFEAESIAGKFFEHGIYEKHLFGTTLDAVRQVVNQGKICILVVEPEALRALRFSDLKPYVVSVYPPNLEKLKQIKASLGLAKATDDELKMIITRGRELEDKYGHLFDYVLVNSDLNRAYDELLLEINRLELEPQWVPAFWMSS